jgi:hypothetical protein
MAAAGHGLHVRGSLVTEAPFLLGRVDAMLIPLAARRLPAHISLYELLGGQSEVVVMTGWPLARTPYYFIGPRPLREAELAAYIRREHRRGRRLAEVLDDPYIHNRGGRALLQAVLGSPALIRALGEDVADAIRVQEGELELTRAWLSAVPPAQEPAG